MIPNPCLKALGLASASLRPSLLVHSRRLYHPTKPLGNQAPLYPTHVPTSLLQKGLLAVGSALVGVIEPTRGDMIATLGETTGRLALQRMYDRMISHPVGAEILKERPYITSQSVDVDKLRSYPEGTFGREYVRFLDDCHVSPDTRDDVRFVDSVDLAYVMLRYRQIHDFVHTLLDMPISVEAEIAVKWFEMVQTGLPMTMAGSLFGPMRLPPKEMAHVFGVWVPWALKCGAESEFLMNVYFEKHFEENIDDFRRHLRVTPAPKP
eukprot:comp15888_c0_seq2/m.13238 comp15888_c0_seq2/g.13238  ORF comp15888_c0_seq2/g.13238 comp15888_c0_seq2/m.13238 type:complete len:265 (-) comp15888_c0_seq2:82-876(-)